MIDPEGDPVGIEVVEDCARMGWDYIELALRDVAALSVTEFFGLVRRLDDSGLRCEACNNFFPPAENHRPRRGLRFADEQYPPRSRPRQAHWAEVVVFGSSGGNIPEGFPGPGRPADPRRDPHDPGTSRGARRHRRKSNTITGARRTFSSPWEAVKLCDEADKPAVGF
jgi:hypothetical protein